MLEVCERVRVVLQCTRTIGVEVCFHGGISSPPTSSNLAMEF